MSSPRSSSVQGTIPAKPGYACIRCSERKVKCNRQTPCESCIRHNVECIFRASKPPRRKREFVKDKLVDERLKRYEALLREKGIDPNQIADCSESASPHQNTRSQPEEVSETSWKLPMQSAVFKPQLRHGQDGTELVDNSLWSRVAEEMHDSESILEEDSGNDVSHRRTSNDDFTYILDGKPSTAGSLHPTPELIRRLWQTFIENVNPITKLVHVPSLQLVIEKAITNIELIPARFEALMFAIYSMAILSLTDSECREIVGESRAILLPRYVAATKGALSRAKFMSSTSLVVLQALLLHIMSIRDDYEARAVWTLTGVAIRVADGMGMGLDGTLLGLSPFESEIRRRIWWQLKLHDFRAAELCGQAKFQDFKLDETTPKKPANVNDSDMYPEMPQAPVESTRPTEMIWCTYRTELASFAAAQISRMGKLGKPALQSDEYAAFDFLKMKDIFIKELEDVIETKYLRFCDPSDPLHLMTLVGARCAMNIVRFMVHHPRRWTKLEQVPASEQQLVWNITIQLLEQYDMQQSNPQLQRFAWNVPWFLNWPAIIHVLDTLRAEPLHIDAAKAWKLIEAVYRNNTEMLLNMRKPIFAAVGGLCLKAFNARQAALAKEKSTLPDPPEYIAKLREQWNAARARRKTGVLRMKGRENFYFDTGKTSNITDVDGTWDANQRSAEVQIKASPQQYQSTPAAQAATQTTDDDLWLTGGDELRDDFFFGVDADTMNLDTDAILAQDYWLDTLNDEAIDWAQWDTWLGNADPVRSNIGAGHL
ncbi:hypothetical protein N431DRAFT_388094 [Stipitochalara longipes BDJ]|nr:hypothetical protein N431DRAFT_388094 [Stipitochalara longipes BDJ]